MKTGRLCYIHPYYSSVHSTTDYDCPSSFEEFTFRSNLVLYNSPKGERIAAMLPEPITGVAEFLGDIEITTTNGVYCLLRTHENPMLCQIVKVKSL